MYLYDSIADINKLSSYGLFFGSVIILILTSLIYVPYGRYSTSKGWGILVNCRLAWFLMESPNLWVTFLLLSAQLASATSSSSMNPVYSWPNIVLMSYFLVHYINRSIIFPLWMSKGNPMPITVMLSAVIFCTWNAFNQASYLLIVHAYDISWLYDPRFIIGSCLFVFGLSLNIMSDSTLLALRKLQHPAGKGKKHQASAATTSTAGEKFHYQVPRGGMFEYVSCANYLGEILEWIGFAISCWSLPALAFALSTICTLLPRAVKHHQWYIDKLDDYPEHRKAVIPFIL